MDLPELLSGDPNVGTNRVPERSELSTLQDLIKYNENFLQIFNEQLSKERDRCAEIRQRYDDQLRILEGIKSEWHSANSLIATMENNKLRIGNDLARLYGLVHPIRRYPTDVLKYIFEWAVIMAEEYDEIWGEELCISGRLKCATNISHVCRRWRKIALESPLLWNHIRIFTGLKPAKVPTLWRHIRPRLKAISPRIEIYGISGTKQELDTINNCQLNQLPQIEHLNLHVTDIKAGRLLATHTTLPLIRRLGHLSISIDSGGSVQESSVNDMLKKYPAAPSVSLVQFPGRYWTVAPILSHITNLEVHHSFNIPLQYLVGALPNIKTATFRFSRFGNHESGTILWSQIHTLRLSVVTGIPWSSLKTPKLTILGIGDANMDEDGLAFISNHSSLQHIEILELSHTFRDASGDYPKLLSFIPAIIANTPKLSSFGVRVHQDLIGLSKWKLSHLQELHIYENFGLHLSVKLFEKVVRTHCLHHEVANQDVQASNSVTLKIMVPYNVDVQELEWRNSSLMALAVEEASVVVDWDPNEASKCQYNSYALKWV